MNKTPLGQKYELKQITSTEFPNENMYQKVMSTWHVSNFIEVDDKITPE